MEDQPPKPTRDPRLEIPEVLREQPTPQAPRATHTPVGGAMQDIGRALAIGIDFLVTAAGGGIVGWLADRQFGIDPWGLLIGLSLGFGGGLFRLIKRLNEDDKPSTKPSTRDDAQRGPRQS